MLPLDVGLPPVLTNNIAMDNNILNDEYECGIFKYARGMSPKHLPREFVTGQSNLDQFGHVFIVGSGDLLWEKHKSN